MHKFQIYRHLEKYCTYETTLKYLIYNINIFFLLSFYFIRCICIVLSSLLYFILQRPVVPLKCELTSHYRRLVNRTVLPGTFLRLKGFTRFKSG